MFKTVLFTGAAASTCTWNVMFQAPVACVRVAPEFWTAVITPERKLFGSDVKSVGVSNHVAAPVEPNVSGNGSNSSARSKV